MTLVPTIEAEGQTQLPNGATLNFDDTLFFLILLGGDWLTVARIREVQLRLDTHLKRVGRFEGLVPVVEDWHTRMTFMIVSMQIAGQIQFAMQHRDPSCTQDWHLREPHTSVF